MTTANIKSLQFSDAKAYLFAAFFVAGNILVPQLCHLIPQGGLIFLPIYFFTLIAAYKFGWRVGLMTAVLSPIVNNALFGMPPAPMLPIIFVKSGLLVASASFVAHKAGKVSLLAVAIAVIAAFVVAIPVEWAMTGSLQAALQDLTLGLPGIAIQIFGGWALMKYVIK
ncbi:MAG: ECF transporter S component [Muribaculaceae bacterium]|nr:ECF transporter S component [Muribaculaceae bacterium]